MEILLAKLALATTLLLGMLTQLQTLPSDMEITPTKNLGAVVETPVKVKDFLQKKGAVEYSRQRKSDQYEYGYRINHGKWQEEHFFYGSTTEQAKDNFYNSIK